MSRRLRQAVLAAAVAWVWSAHIAHCAEFKKWPLPNGKGDLIAVAGDLVSGDDKTFVNIALNSSDAIVVFQSPGGSLLAGIEIGKAIHLKGFATYVPDGMQCASACALAWLGGQRRFMSASARIGFHAVYTDDGGQPIVSSTGNALVGAYLSQIGLPNSAVVYITEAAPTGMQWLTPEDARQYGIDVRLLNLTTAGRDVAPQASPPMQIAPSITPPSAEQVTRETHSFVATSNLPSERAITLLENRYADQVSYYGKVLDRAAVLKDKMTFFQRWPVRNYVIQPETLKVNCVTPSSCVVDGVMSWNDRRPDLISTGTANFSLGWSLGNNDQWRIVSETGHVINRNVAHPSVSKLRN